MDELVRDLYGSLAGETRLEQSLHRLGAAFRSHISGLHTEDFGMHRGRLTLVGDVSADEYARLTGDYSHRWGGQNLWMERSLEGFLSKGYEQGDAVVSESELRRSAYYQHFLKPLDIRRGIGICIWNDEKLNMAVASFHRGHGDVAFDEDDIALIGQLRPHLANAYAIHRRFAQLDVVHGSLRASFERAPLAMLVLDAEGVVLECNASADRLLRAGTGIARGLDGRLLLTSAASRQAYAQAVARIAASEVATPASILIRTTGEGDRSLVLHLCGFPPAMGAELPRRGRMLGFLGELRPDEREDLDTQILCQALGLTRAEARTALALRRHPEVDAAAQWLNVAPATIRTHVKGLFRKLGVNHSGKMLLIVDRLVSSAP